MNDNMTVIGDWPPRNPSPRTFMSNFLNEEDGSKSFSYMLSENGSESSLCESEKPKMSMNSREEFVEDRADFSSKISFEPGLCDGRRSSSKGGLAQRIAKAGFNAPTINTYRIKSANMASASSEVGSPYLTIPPGLSPTTLLDSPVFLSNSMAQPSPTTGKFSFLCNAGNSSISVSDSGIPDISKDAHSEDIPSGGVVFKPPLNTMSSYISNLENQGSSPIDQQQSLHSISLSFKKDFDLPAVISESSDRKDGADDSTLCPGPTDSFVGYELSPPLEDQPDGQADTKGEFSSVAVAAPAEDGYNWRKYGQKQVKGSEHPRSYYKCTYPGCPVKKNVERSHEGHITEIIYKGSHNHAKPLPNRRSGVPSSHPFHDVQMDGLEHPGSQANFDGKPSLRAADVMDATSSASIAAEFGDSSALVQTHDVSSFGSPETIDVSSTVSSDKEEDQATHGSVSLGGDGEGDESESKRRKLDACAVEMNTASRAVREPRVVVQTKSEVDVLDDGYRWRKYGQKVVKGNPNPRSYYKCTNPGCTVRKHVERASHDLKSVITTYEGKHNHDVPAARNNNHSSSGPSITASAPTAQAHNQHRKPEPIQDGLVRFDGPPPMSRFNLPGREQQLGLGPGFSFGMAQPGLANLRIGSLGQVKMPVLGPIHSYMGQLASNTGGGFMVPRGEPKEEPVSESGLPNSNGMTAYHQLLRGLPLGPQL